MSHFRVFCETISNVPNATLSHLPLGGPFSAQKRCDHFCFPVAWLQLRPQGVPITKKAACLDFTVHKGPLRYTSGGLFLIGQHTLKWLTVHCNEGWWVNKLFEEAISVYLLAIYHKYHTSTLTTCKHHLLQGLCVYVCVVYKHAHS